jgi:AraC-like DNA-binding protein
VERLYEQVDRDAVTALLATLRVHSTIYCCTEFRVPWGMALKPAAVPVFHLFTRGDCWLEIDELDEPVALSAGDVVVFMTGRGHRMCDNLASPTEVLDDILATTPPSNGTLTHGGTGELTEMICGTFQLEGAPANPLLLSLPPVLRLDGRDDPTAHWVDALLTMVRAELNQPVPGGEAMLARLADLLITQTIRTFLSTLTESDGVHAAALRDPRITKAVRLFLTELNHPWTVDEMAAEVAMSRSSFAAIFRQLTGETPIRYLTRCRLARAAAYLASSDLTVFAVAQLVGYDSEASLTRAFSRMFGTAPGSYRRRLHDQPGSETPQVLPEITTDAETRGDRVLTD